MVIERGGMGLVDGEERMRRWMRMGCQEGNAWSSLDGPAAPAPNPANLRLNDEVPLHGGGRK